VINKDSGPFWELPGDEPRTIVTGLQNQTPVDLSGIEITERQLRVDGRTITLYVVRPEGIAGTLPVFMFFHGAVWIAGNFENHKRLVRDLVVGSGAVAVFPEYTPVPEARYPVQVEQAHAAAVWVSENGDDLGVDSSKLAGTGKQSGRQHGRRRHAAGARPRRAEHRLPAAALASAERTSTPSPIASTARVVSYPRRSWSTAGITTHPTPRRERSATPPH
jgi:hypothetical protein